MTFPFGGLQIVTEMSPLRNGLLKLFNRYSLITLETKLEPSDFLFHFPG